MSLRFPSDQLPFLVTFVHIFFEFLFYFKRSTFVQTTDAKMAGLAKINSGDDKNPGVSILIIDLILY